MWTKEKEKAKIYTDPLGIIIPLWVYVLRVRKCKQHKRIFFVAFFHSGCEKKTKWNASSIDLLGSSSFEKETRNVWPFLYTCYWSLPIISHVTDLIVV